MIKVGKEGVYEKYQSFIYAHGELEDCFGTDLISATKDLPLGIYEVSLGTYHTGLAFVWDGNLSKTGLITFHNDKEACNYAFECWRTKAKSF
jgi:hypothetical protein